MLAYTIRRVLISIPVLIGSSILVFLMVKFSGDPLEPLKVRNPPAPKHTIELEQHRLGLDRSSPERNWMRITNLGVPGNFGPAGPWGDNISCGLGSRVFVSV